MVVEKLLAALVLVASVVCTSVVVHQGAEIARLSEELASLRTSGGGGGAAGVDSARIQTPAAMRKLLDEDHDSITNDESLLSTEPMNTRALLSMGSIYA